MTRVSDERALWLRRQVLPHEPALRAWLRRKSLGGLDVDDIIQETYTRLVAADSVAHVLDARSYAFQVAGSVVIDHLRRMKVVSISQAPNFDYLEVVSDEPSPERQVIDRDELQHLARMIARLPGRVREVFTLRRVYGLSQREVAHRMGIAESTVEKHMSRGFLLMIMPGRWIKPADGLFFPSDLEIRPRAVPNFIAAPSFHGKFAIFAPYCQRY